MHNCAECGRALTQDEIGATKKLINRAAEEYYCLPCLAKKFRVDERTLRGKIEYWRGIGCTLFPPKEE
ncbi:MAG: hypothetical protein J5925_07235 [Clostridia bacterium]|nr:hypothetical protein [Clostridia bacterium]MBR5746774.1 hypothetical protein [Clostridia bacterium]